MGTPACDPDRRRIEAALLEWMREDDWKQDEDRFDALALELFAFQFRCCAAYAAFCRGRAVEGGRVGHWSEIPAVPAGAFKETALRSFEAEATQKIFRTSGTRASRRGELHLDTLELYEASLLPTITRYCFSDCKRSLQRMSIQILAPSPAEVPDSSLSHMFGRTLEAFGSRDSGYSVRDGRLQHAELFVEFDRCVEAQQPIALCGTAFAFVHLLDAIAARGSTYCLPPGSRIMETGGFKGRAREMKWEELYAALFAALGIREDWIVNQYGMTELGSQFYDTLLFDALFQRDVPRVRGKASPPWTRVRIVDPETGIACADGEAGMIVIHDLANTGSVAAIETADIGQRLAERPELFEVLGRDADAEERGCSIAFDSLLRGDER